MRERRKQRRGGRRGGENIMFSLSPILHFLVQNRGHTPAACGTENVGLCSFPFSFKGSLLFLSLTPNDDHLSLISNFLMSLGWFVSGFTIFPP